MYSYSNPDWVVCFEYVVNESTNCNHCHKNVVPEKKYIYWSWCKIKKTLLQIFFFNVWKLLIGCWYSSIDQSEEFVKKRFDELKKKFVRYSWNWYHEKKIMHHFFSVKSISRNFSKINFVIRNSIWKNVWKLFVT